jgi:3-oxoacyl-[acyl-carrier protein] reductase
MNVGCLDKKNAIITGCNRGIGLEILHRFAKEGANVWACVRKENEDFLKYCAQLEMKYSVSVTPVYFDLQNEEELNHAVKKILSEKKEIDILVNNAGIAYGNLFQMTSMTKLKEVFEINYFSQIRMMQMVSRYMMKQKKGSIINMASVGGIEANPGYLAYGSSKAALIWATKCLAREVGSYQVRVNAVAPGLVDTSMGHYKSEEERENVLARTPLQRMGTSAEVASAVLFLASDESSYVTGQVFRVDGGR